MYVTYCLWCRRVNVLYVIYAPNYANCCPLELRELKNLNSKLPEAKKNENKSWLVQDLYQIGLEGARSFFTNHRAK